MKLQSKKTQKGEGESNFEEPGFSSLQNGSAVSNTPEFPMKPFKGTKFHLENNEGKTLKSRKKREADTDMSNEMNLKKGKMSKYNPLNIMSKLEEFSDVWNDCPDVENPKSNFEIVPNHKNETEVYMKEKNFKHTPKRLRETDTLKWSIPNGSEKAQHFKERNALELQVSNERHLNSHEKRSKRDPKDNKNNEFKDQLVKDGVSVSEKNVAEMKRKKAMEEQHQLHADQKNIIKKALSAMESKQQTNKKIVFSDAEDNSESQLGPTGVNTTKTKKLFEDDDDSSEADLELKVNKQFEGKKGQKLLELQSKFASDSRFTLDSRFHDSESENEKEEAPFENLDVDKEKRRQLEILESIVKQPIRPLSETKKIVPGKKCNGPSMVRFDPTREDHQKYLLKPQKPLKEKEELKEKKKSKKSMPNVEENKPQVSSEKIYAVKEDLKEVLKQENKTEFSLLKLFGSKDEDSVTQQNSSESLKKLKYATKNPFRYDSSESESEEEEVQVEVKATDVISVAKPSLPSWRTTFFFTDNDSRLKEAEEFLKKSEEQEDNQEFAEKRKMLKDFIRHKVKNSNRKKDPFKKKLGGVKKKVFHKKKRK